MRSGFLDGDVYLLLKDITGLVEPLPTEIREKNIQNGMHYSEMLPIEYKPTKEYLRIYGESLEIFGQATADAVARVSERIIEKKGKDVVLVSLARAGTPIGILVKRYIIQKYGYEVPHYSISIIRDRGIDRNAISYILNRHLPKTIQFLDGWTGKGVIYNELKKEIGKIGGVSDSLAVLSDPAYITEICGTHEDIMIPSSCLNCTVCGLISRTFLREDIIKDGDFHGSAYYRELQSEDRTYEFIDYITKKFQFDLEEINQRYFGNQSDVNNIAEKYKISNINYIKPGIGETTRVLLRRVPWKILIDERYKDSKELAHIRQLASEREVEIELARLDQYKCCGLIKQMSDI